MFALLSSLPLGAALLSALVGGLAAVERKGALQLMLSRPLALAAILGWALGDPQGGLFVGVPLELLFLGGVNLGGSLPDHETLLASTLTAAVVTAGSRCGGVDGTLAALGLFFLAPIAPIGRRLELRAEQHNGVLAEAIAARVAAGDPDAVSLQLRGLVWPLLGGAAAAGGAALLGPALGWLRRALPAAVDGGLAIAWHLVGALALAAAVLAVRDARARLFAGLAAVATFAAAALVGKAW